MKKRLIQLLGTVLLLVCPVLSQAQINYQYWIDNNIGAAVSGTTTASGDISLAIDMADQTPGIHFYNLRAREGKKWGPVYRYLFAIPHEQQTDATRMITGYRYGFGDEMKTVTFDTPVSEYTLNQAFDVPVPPLPTVIDDDCHFSFNDDEATLLRNITMAFALTFTDESNAISSPIGTSFTLTDTRTSDIQTLEVAGSLPIEAHAQGGYTVVKLEIPAADNYTLTTTAASSLRLFSSIGATLTTIGSDDLTAGYAQDYETGTYYAVVYSNTEEVMLKLTGGSEPCGYAILDSETGTLTFKYGVMPSSGNVWKTENTNFVNAPWVSGLLTKVVFDASYADARPTSTAKWFMNANRLTEIIGFEYLNTSNVTDMSSMFCGCQSLTALDLSNFDTHNVDTFGGEKSDFGYVPGMFTDCEKLTVLNLSSFSTAKVETMNVMFSECWKLETIYVGEGWTTENVTESNHMFRNCPKLVGGKGTKYNANYVDKTYARIDGGTDSPGYFTDKASMKAGDVNRNGVLDTNDAVDLIDFMAGKSPNGVTTTSADINSDGVVNVADLIMLINDLLKESSWP